MRLTEEERIEIIEQAKELGSDGCSAPSEVFHICCLEHDIAYRTGKNFKGESVTRKQTDARFKQCMQEESKLGKFSGMALARWILVRIFGRGIWRKK